MRISPRCTRLRFKKKVTISPRLPLKTQLALSSHSLKLKRKRIEPPKNHKLKNMSLLFQFLSVLQLQNSNHRHRVVKRSKR